MVGTANAWPRSERRKAAEQGRGREAPRLELLSGRVALPHTNGVTPGRGIGATGSSPQAYDGGVMSSFD